MDFSTAGQKSGIDYSESFKKYKHMLTQKRETPTYRKIYAEFDAALFGKAQALSGDFIADDGDYDSEVERFNRELEEEELAEAEAASHPPSTSTPPSLSIHAEADEVPPLPSTPPPQLDHRVSISVTSNVSHTVAASSQVSNVINSTSPPLERDVMEAPPLVQKAARQAQKKKGGKSKSTTTTPGPDVDTNAAPTQNT